MPPVNLKPIADLASRALRSDTARQLGRSLANEGTRIAKDVAVPELKRQLQKGVLSALESRTASATLGPRPKTDFSALGRPSPGATPGGAKPGSEMVFTPRPQFDPRPQNEPEMVFTERPQIQPQPSAAGGAGGLPSLRAQLKATAQSTLQQAAQAAFKAASGVATDGAQQAHAAVMGKLGLPPDAKPHQMLGLQRPPITPEALSPVLENLFRRLKEAASKKGPGAGQGADRSQRAQELIKRVTGAVAELRQFAAGQLETASQTKTSLEAKFAHLPTTGPQVRSVLGAAMHQLAGVIGQVQAMLEAEAQRMSAAAAGAEARPAEAPPAPAGPARSEADLATMKKMGLPADASDHDIVGASPDADDAQLRTSYRQTMLKHHPDKPGGSAEAAALISGAFERLGVKPAGTGQADKPAGTGQADKPASIEGQEG